MKEYKVLKGQIHENGKTYKEGDTFLTTPYRAVELGLKDGKIEEVITAPEELDTDASKDKAIADLTDSLDKVKEENERLKADNASKDKAIADLTKELDEAKSKLEKIAELEKENQKLQADLLKAQEDAGKKKK